MDVLEIIDSIEDLVEGAKPAFFSNKVAVGRDEILDLLSELRLKLPDDIKQATWIKSERERILNEARLDADKVVNDAKVELGKLLSEESVLIEAKKEAAEIINSAMDKSVSISLGSIDYTDKVLTSTQENLNKVIDTLNDNRRQLAEMAAQIKRNNQ
ncbi:MAG: ATPase [Ezakiella sp.]|nr:ATPase [Ezakiella sp.]MDD7471547.1 ATPase [Bacillota bacterium]MDY3922783.1 ATPase [Ezakiella sp.]